MKVYRELCTVSEASGVALGLFDGVHLAHTEVIRQILQCENLVSTVLTFQTAGAVLENKPGMKMILTDEQRLYQLSLLGVERVLIPPFSAIANLSAREFFSEIIVRRLQTRKISCGYDYTFGKGAEGTAELMQSLCRKEGITLSVLSPLCGENGNLICSTAIRKNLSEGKIEQANQMLGYPYYILGEVERGRSLGRTLGFPTLNQALSPELVLPKFGVYASSTEILGREYKSITNIGVKPTIAGERAPLAETHLLDSSGNFYGQTAKVSLYSMIRPEKQFSSVQELKVAVDRDIITRRKL